ncbi:MAG: hypothetical protein IKV98_09855 [Clostridia bacterium]|nr:hypothetical protein [Clostridia bacterium]
MNSGLEATRPRAYDEIFGEKTENVRRFFGAANTRKGFVSFFDKIFSPENIDLLYILGGGPGSGKSTLLKKIAALSEKNGFTTDRIHCSSSPTSLDGVIIGEKRIAVIDGTSPHTYSPTCPGVREIAVDLGRGWDTKALSKRKETITYLGAAKSKAYKKAYIYLRAASLIADDENVSTLGHVLSEKMQKNVVSTLQKELGKEKPSSASSPEIRLQRAVSGKGNVYFESFSQMAQKTYLVRDFRGVGGMWLGILFDEAKKRQIPMTVSFSPEDPDVIDGIFLKEQKCAFTRYASRYDKVINCERFADKEFFAASARRHSFLEKSKASLLRESYDALSQASKFHDLIEEEYFPCTDFSIIDGITEKLCKDIF